MARRLAWVTIFWLVECTFYVGTSLKATVGVQELLEAARVAVGAAAMWIPTTMWALWAAARFPVERGHLVGRLAFHVATGLALLFARAVVTMLINPWMHLYPTLPPFSQVLLNSLRGNLLLYVLVLGAAHALHYARRARERERQAETLKAQVTEARLAALRSQLNPHFLFNALGAIAELVHRDADAADRMIVRLSRLLRLALDDSDVKEVTLAHELGCLEPYLELEKMRLGERLSVTLDIDPDAREALVPALLLQPLVENAIRHGIAPRSAPGRVAIRARRDGETLWLEVEDDGAGISNGAEQGIGLRNTQARLDELYGPASTFEIDGAPDHGTRVRVSVPQAHDAT